MMKSHGSQAQKGSLQDRIHANLEKEKSAVSAWKLRARNPEYQQDICNAMSEYVTQATATFLPQN